MFCVGDKVVYPTHGAGVIEAIEEKRILGKKKLYYIMRTMTGNMTLMIPTDNGEQTGIRSLISRDEAKKVLEYFKNSPIEPDHSWNQRQRENMSKIKSGDIYQVLDVLKELMYRDRTKGLSTSERKLLNSASQIALSELVMSGVADKSDVECIMNDTIEGML